MAAWKGLADRNTGQRTVTEVRNMISVKDGTCVPVGEQDIYDIRFPQSQSDMAQDEAWCEVHLDGDWRRFRFHDYNEIYQIPGLYETLFYRTLRCNSPAKVVGLLSELLAEYRQSTDSIRAFDVGAGNGMVGEALQSVGIRDILGLDIIAEAKDAAIRDRPWVYNNYQVADLTALPERVEESIRKSESNLLMTVAALGFGDIPDPAFLKALDLVETPAWVAFNVKEQFLDNEEADGFAGLINKLTREKIIRIEATRRYRHRISYLGEPLYYVAVVASKLNDVPGEWLSDVPDTTAR